MFVEDLSNVAKEFKRILTPKGEAVISVIHPVYWHTNFLLNEYEIEPRPEFSVMDKGYYSTGKEIVKTIGGNENLQMGFTHRTLKDYMEPFLEVGLTLTGLDEPKITEKFLETNPRFADRLNIPMRLNFRVQNLG